MSSQTLRMLSRRKNVDGYQNMFKKQLEDVFALPPAPTPKPSPRPTPRLKPRLTSKLTPRPLPRSTLALTSVSINDFEKSEIAN